MSTKKGLKYAKEETILAERRTILSSTRTFLSYMRTAIVIISLAFAFMKLDKEHPIDAFTIILFVLAGVIIIVGIVEWSIARKYAKDVGITGE